ncbi:hypothetical protein BGZ79_009717, partial [Entomortierella chlamydospora]
NAIGDLYTRLKPASTADSPAGIQPEELVPQLLPFQQRSVSWLLSRESATLSKTGKIVYKSQSAIDRLPFSWEQIHLRGLGRRQNLWVGTLRRYFLAEEMGLGKTVEMLALVLFHRRHVNEETGFAGGDLVNDMLVIQLNEADRSVSNPKAPVVHSPSVGLTLIISSATLIITPPSILRQWVGEIENHAPGLKVYIYLEEKDKSINAEELATYDIVLTTYSVLPRTPAQMIEGSTVSQAAAMTLMIPRVMSWAISGTPIRRHIEDLHSLLRFLNQEPIASSKKLWKLLMCFSFRPTFISSYQIIMHRNSKKDVAHELTIPKQQRLIHSIDFSDIERNYYMDVWDDCHPRVGTSSKESSGRKDIRTIDTVLGVMVRKASNLLGLKERALITSKIRRAVLSAQIDGGAKELELFEEIEEQVRECVLFWKDQAEKRLTTKISSSSNDEGRPTSLEVDIPSATSSSVARVSDKRSEKRNADAWVSPSSRFRDWQEQQHRILYYMAANYGRLGMSAKEAQYYSLATSIRDDMLSAPERQFNASLDLVMRHMHEVSLEELKAISTSVALQGGATWLKLLRQLKMLVEFMNKQRVVINNWWLYLLETLAQPLPNAVDDNIHNSVEVQSSVESYLHNYSRMVYLRKDILIGAQTVIANYVGKARDARNHARMVAEREKRVKKLAGSSYIEEEESLDQTLEKEIYGLLNDEIVHSIKNIGVLIESIANAKTTSTDDKTRATAESDRVQSLLSQQLAQVEFFEKELENLQMLASARALYFHHLQGISDTVISIDSKNPYNDISKCLGGEVILKAEIAKLTSKLKYLEHTEDTIAGSIGSEEKANSEADTEDRLCLICSDQYHYGLLTECGHTFCKSCLLEWTKSHSKCPSCKGHISKSRLKPFSMVFSSMSSMSVPADRAYSQNMDKTSLEDFHTALSSDLMQPVPERIQLVKIQGGYGSKIDSVVRHIKFLTREDPLVKCLVFFQWSNLLHLLTESLTINQIGHIRLDGASNKSAVHEFKTNKDKHVFMLHAKSQSAVDLLQATHIFICEPLVNPAIQAQAVSRVHRIGQTKKTFVHYYLLKDTVEIPCFELFERNSASAVGSNGIGLSKSKSNVIANEKSITATSKIAEIDVIGISDDSEDIEVHEVNLLGSDTVTTATESAESQRNNGEGQT